MSFGVVVKIGQCLFFSRFMCRNFKIQNGDQNPSKPYFGCSDAHNLLESTVTMA